MHESYYFPHDYDAQNDPKLQALISKFKSSGYGIYWAIIEMLHKEKEHFLPLKQYVFTAIAKQMLTSAKQIEELINFAITECDLFVEKDGFFTSRRVLRNFEKRAEISEKRSEAGKKGAIAKQNLANASKGKEKKGKEKKYINTHIPELSEFVEYAKTIKIYTPSFDFQIEAKYNAWKEAGWRDGNNKAIKNWKTKLQNTMPYFAERKTNNGKDSSGQRRKDYVSADEVKSELKNLYEGRA